MAILAGQILHAMNQFVVDRIQTGGPGNLNIPTERIYELGNYESVAIVRDIPDLSFNLDCLDVDTEVEALLLGSTDPGGDPIDSTSYALANSINVDIVSPWKSARGQFDIVKGVAIPQLTLESASYRYGLRDNAGETFTLRGDSIFYTPGTPYQDVAAGTGAQTTFNFANGPAQVYTNQGVSTYALNVSVDGVRQRLGATADYTETATGITFNTAPANGAVIRVVYSSATAATYNQSVHQGVAVKPAAIKGKDIKVFVGTSGATPQPIFWTDVQSFNADYRVTLEDDYEFGNDRAVAREYAGAPEVSGSVEVKSSTVDALFAKLQQITGVSASEVIGPQSSTALEVEVQLLNPASGGTSAVPVGTVLKTLYIPDARFTVPGYEGRANQKLTQTLNFESDSGTLTVFKGERF